jgi:Putative beta-barrel porin-2, OmpL-like. bbp2
MIAVVDFGTFSGMTALLLICVFAVCFMLRFLAALSAETRRPTVRMFHGVFHSGSSKVHQFPVPAAIPLRTISASGEATRMWFRSETSLGRIEHENRLVEPIEIMGASGTHSSPRKRVGKSLKHWLLAFLLLAFFTRTRAEAQNAPTSAPSNQPAAPASPSPLPTPPITGPLQAAPPITFDGGPFGELNVNGIVSGMGLWQGNHVPGDNTGQAALSNGQIFLQKTTSWWQFYIQAGAYDILSLGTPFLSTQKTISDLYGPVPVGYLKLVPTKDLSIEIGSLPTLMGAEYTFSFQNMNIERGLLWNQENAINRGIQVNETRGKFTASLSWNDGYYSNRYSWLSGSLTYANGPHSFTFAGMGNLSQTAFQTLATPVQNNSTMYAAIYTYTKGSWIVQPYFQYSNVPTNPKIGIVQGASTRGGAVLVNHTFKHGVSLSGRGEYLSTSGSLAAGSVNLLYGPGSSAWSITLTPTYQYKRFFTRGDLSFVRARSFTSGDAFGPNGTNPNQPRGVIEAGFLF